jgi:predicted XRE-type DNA-binding protein
MPRKKQNQTSAVGNEGKAKIAREITAEIVARKLTQTEAGALLGISQGDVSSIKNEKFLERFTLDRLLTMARAMGRDVEITLSVSRSATGKLSVACR